MTFEGAKLFYDSMKYKEAFPWKRLLFKNGKSNKIKSHSRSKIRRKSKEIKKEFEEHLANDTSSESKILFKYKKRRKQARKLMGLPDDTGAKGELRSHRTRAEKLDEFFVWVLTVKDVGEVSVLNVFFIAD